MSLKLTQLHVQNFKCLRDATFHWHRSTNILTGRNNSGKTTAIEAIALWAELFALVKRQAQKAIPQRGIRKGDWYLEATHLEAAQFSSVRSPSYADLFHEDAEELRLTASLEDAQGQSATVPISVYQARGQRYGVLPKLPPEGDQQLASLIQNWNDPIRAHFASPVAAISPVEEFATRPKVDQVIRNRRSAEVLRNRLFALANAGELPLLCDDVSLVLTGQRGQFSLQLGPLQDAVVEARVTAQIGSKSVPRDLSLLGSGTLQVLEALLGLYWGPTDLHLLLLDEPDSHIHRDIQRRLLAKLDQHADRVQVFLTTHNESLLRAAPWEQVFHLSDDPAAPGAHHWPIRQSAATGPKRGAQPTPLQPVLADLGAETALDVLTALEADHLMLVEGRDDANAIQRILELERIGAPPRRAAFWALDGIDQGLRALPVLLPVLGSIRNERSLRDRALLVLDADMFTTAQVATLEDALASHPKLKIPTFVWPGATCAEGAILNDGPSTALTNLLTRFDHECGNQADAQRMEESLDVLWDELLDRLRERVTAIEAGPWIGRFKQRKDLLDGAGLGKVLAGRSEGEHFDNWRRWALAELEAGNASAVAAKTDVAWLVWRACVDDGTPELALSRFEASPWWRDLLVQAHRDTWFSGWQALVDRLKAAR